MYKIKRKCKLVQTSAIRVIRSEQGFTLLEVIVAVVILGVGLLSVGLMQVTYMSGNESAVKSTYAAVVAEQEIERLMGLLYNGSDDNNSTQVHPDLKDGAHTAVTRTLDGVDYTVQWTVANNTSLSMKVITLTVNWKDNSTAEAERVYSDTRTKQISFVFARAQGI